MLKNQMWMKYAPELLTEWQQLMEEGLSRKDAVKQTAKELNLPKNVVYDAALK